jgi:hypothetical protein
VAALNFWRDENYRFTEEDYQKFIGSELGVPEESNKNILTGGEKPGKQLPPLAKLSAAKKRIALHKKMPMTQRDHTTSSPNVNADSEPKNFNPGLFKLDLQTINGPHAEDSNGRKPLNSVKNNDFMSIKHENANSEASIKSPLPDEPVPKNDDENMSNIADRKDSGLRKSSDNLSSNYWPADSLPQSGIFFVSEISNRTLWGYFRG